MRLKISICTKTKRRLSSKTQTLTLTQHRKNSRVNAGSYEFKIFFETSANACRIQVTIKQKGRNIGGNSLQIVSHTMHSRKIHYEAFSQQSCFFLNGRKATCYFQEEYLGGENSEERKKRES
jgi:hypothetical protein